MGDTMADEDSNPKEAKSVPKLAWTAALKDKLGGSAAETPSAGRDGWLFFVETKDFFLDSVPLPYPSGQRRVALLTEGRRRGDI